MWHCPSCSESVDSTFEVCWNCGTLATGESDPGFKQEEQITKEEAAVLPAIDLASLQAENKQKLSQSTRFEIDGRSLFKSTIFFTIFVAMAAWIVSPWPWSDYMQRADSFQRSGFYRFAVYDYTRAIELHGEAVGTGLSSFYGRARVYEDLSEYQFAIDDFSVLLAHAEYYPHREVIFLCERAENYIRLGKYNDAVKDLDRAIKLRPEYRWAFDLLRKAKLQSRLPTR